MMLYKTKNVPPSHRKKKRNFKSFNWTRCSLKQTKFIFFKKINTKKALIVVITETPQTRWTKEKKVDENLKLDFDQSELRYTAMRTTIDRINEIDNEFRCQFIVEVCI